MSDAPLTPAALKRRIGGGFAATGAGDAHPHAPLLVDLRARRSFTRGHIPGSHNISRARLLSGEPPERDLILISDHGNLDAAVAAHLHDSGFHRRIEHLQGGLVAWRRAGFPLVEPSGEAKPVATQRHTSLREPWLLSLLLLALAIPLQQGSSPWLISAALLWAVLAALNLLLQRSSRQVLRRCP